MGSSLSQFKKSIEQGDEKQSLDIYYKYSEIRRKLNPNAVIDELTMDTYMHVCARHGMANFLKILIVDKNGNPNMLNRLNQSVLHTCCDGADDKTQYECLQILLQWHEKAKIKKPNYPKHLHSEININEQDIYENSPLHYAAKRNLKSCVQSLVAHGAFLFVENIERCTACDLAERHGNKVIANFLESKMVFSKEEDETDGNLKDEELMVEEKHNFGLRIQDLQEEKDKLILEAAEMLNCNIFTAGIMLKKHGWSKQVLMENWIQDPLKCCEKCGISNVTVEKSYELNTSMESETNGIQNENQKTVINFLNSTEIIARKVSGRYLANRTNLAINRLNNTNKIRKPKSRGSKQKSIYKSQSSLNNNDEKSVKNAFSTGSMFSDSETSLFNSSSFDLTESTTCQICYCTYGELTVAKSGGEDCQPDEVSNRTVPLSDAMTFNVGDSNEFVKIVCGHKFCRSCWEQYLTMKIHEGNVNEIVCPQTDCFAIISNETIESLVSKETAKRYLHFDIKAFVDSNPNIKWCPFPGCGMAVKNPKTFIKKTIHKKVIIPEVHEQHNMITEFSCTVDCGQGHIFCWECLKEAHEPATCKNWKDWVDKVHEMNPEKLTNTNEQEEQSANVLWLVTNAKKCPNIICMAPIQKHEGCNHVKCYKCKYEFCWLCMEPWKKHSGSTGGYFQCNRYEATSKISQKTRLSVSEAEREHSRAVESNKFVHYYTRFKNHENSLKIEQSLIGMARNKFDNILVQETSVENNDEQKSSLEEQQCKKTNNSSFSKTLKILKRLSSSEPVTKSLNLSESKNNLDKIQDLNASNNEQPMQPNDSLEAESSFNSSSEPGDSLLLVEEAIKELVRARQVLRCSYAYGFYLDQYGHQKFIFEYIQTEFEESTENLSQIIARPHLKTSRKKVIRLTNILRRKRIEFLETIRGGLNSFNETPPTLKKYSLQRWKYLLKDNIQHDDEFKNTIAVNLKELNPRNPWIIDKRGRHTNLLALLNDLPILEEELDSILVPAKDKKSRCARWGCPNSSSINTLSGCYCNYCSIKCMRIDRNLYLDKKEHADLKSPRRDPRNYVPISSNIQPSTSQRANTRTEVKPINSSKSIWKSFKLSKKNEPTTASANSVAKEVISEEKLCETGPSFESDSEDKSKNKIENYSKSSLNSDINQDSVNEQALDKPTPADDSNAIMSIQPNQTSETGITMSNKYFTTLPFDALFLQPDNEISYTIKNLENVLYDEQYEKNKIGKECNFAVKVKK